MAKPQPTELLLEQHARILKGLGNGLSVGQAGAMLNLLESGVHSNIVRYRSLEDLVGRNVVRLIFDAVDRQDLSAYDVVWPGQPFTLVTASQARRAGSLSLRLPSRLPQGILAPRPESEPIASAVFTPKMLAATRLVLSGRTDCESADVLGLSEAGFKDRVNKVLAAGGWRNREQLALHVATGVLNFGEALPVPELGASLDDWTPPGHDIEVSIDRLPFATGKDSFALIASWPGGVDGLANSWNAPSGAYN